MSRKTDGTDAIVDRMRELRSTGLRDVSRLHAQVGRVTDWREHVRAHPAVSVIAASILGFSLVRKLTNNPTLTQYAVYLPDNVHTPPVPVAKQSSAMRGILSAAGAMAFSIGRKWLTEYFKKQLRAHMQAAVQPTELAEQSHSNR